MVLAEGPWVEGCERVGETLRVEVAEDAPDLRFDFVGLPEGAEVGYEAFDAAGAPLGGGMGMWVPLSRWEGVRTVAFYGVDGADFSAVRRVSSRVDGGQAAGGTGTKAGLAAARAGSGDGFVVRVIPGGRGGEVGDERAGGGGGGDVDGEPDTDGVFVEGCVGEQR